MLIFHLAPVAMNDKVLNMNGWMNFMLYLNNLKKKYPNLSYAVIIILHIKKLTFMIRKEIKNHQVFCRKKENGWTNF